MAERIIGILVCVLCAFPFYALSLNKNSHEPINFWSGDSSLKDKVQNVAAYNKEMSALYKMYAVAFVIAGLVYLIYPLAGFALLLLDCTAGIYALYKGYKRILHKYS